MDGIDLLSIIPTLGKFARSPCGILAGAGSGGQIAIWVCTWNAIPRPNGEKAIADTFVRLVVLDREMGR